MVWSKAGSTTLDGSADSISVTPIDDSLFYQTLTYIDATGTSINSKVRFNDDSTSNYSSRWIENGSSDNTENGGEQIVTNTDTAQDQFMVTYIVNIAGEEKLLISQTMDAGGSGASTPNRFEAVGKWRNTSDAISRIDVINTSSGDYLSDSNLSILGSG